MNRIRLFVALLFTISSGAVAADASKLKVLVVTGGHGFKRDAFFKVYEDNPNITFTDAKQVKTSEAYDREDLLNYDAIVLYDMVQNITEAQKAKFLSLFDKGVGLLVMHHAIVSYQSWPEFERIIGGTYPEPQDQKGKVTPQLGYEHDVQVPVQIVAKNHPVTAGVSDFTIHDEIYWGFRTRPDVTPLITTTHPKSGKPLMWTRNEKKSRVVYLQLGHGPEAFANPNYRKLVAQSIQFVANKPASAARAEITRRWRHSKRIQFNTSATGANVKADVKNFAVAIALNESNFDFSQARADGSDVRFYQAGAEFWLPHSIEHWDGAAKSALLWVKVPVVRGNSTSQFISMHWDADGALQNIPSTEVFHADDGFVGVWHLSASTENTHRDATANAAHGVGVNLKDDVHTSARLGRGLSLRHAEKQWVKVEGDKRKLFDLTNKLTFSIWAKAHSYGNKVGGYETMFAKGDNSWRLQKFGIRSWHNPPAEIIEICVEKPPKADLCVVGKTDMVTNQWFHFVGVHEHPKVRLYVNGVLDKEEIFDVPWISGDHAVGIGNQSQFPEKGRSWDGVLDEARVLNVAKDEHWVKLDYESQREGQKFWSFGKTETH